MTAGVRRNDPYFFEGRRYIEKTSNLFWGLDGGAGVLRAKIVIFAYLAGAQRLPQARSACCERRRREHCGPSAADVLSLKEKTEKKKEHAAGAQRLPQARSACC